MPRKLAKHHPVAFDREMIVPENVAMFVPALVGIGGGEERRIQIDERLAATRTEIAPQRNLAAVAIALRDLLCPGVNDDGQGNMMSRQQIGKPAHVLERSFDAAI